MPNTPSAIALLIASVVAAVAVTPCRAADLSMASKIGKPAKPVNSSAANDKHRADAKGASKGSAGKAREAQRRIVTYNLFQDPVFKLNGAVADKRQLGVPSVFERLGHGWHAPAVPALKQTGRTAGTAILKLQEPESAGIDFDCRDKPFRPRTNTRELTACYKHNVDRSWKTQTYLSREYTDGTQKWGGGLAVRYAY